MSPWTDPHSIWKTQSAFFSWVRGQLRRSWTNYPISKNFKDAQCRTNHGKGRAKKIANCSQCQRVFAKSHLQVDHVVPAGSIRSWEDVGAFVKGLFTVSPNLRLLCKSCHHQVTQMDRFSLTPQELDLKTRKAVFLKLPIKEQREILEKCGMPLDQTTNQEKRKQALNVMVLNGWLQLPPSPPHSPSVPKKRKSSSTQFKRRIR